jgi:alpha-tubulin suppressor-like RCC1 family protein
LSRGTPTKYEAFDDLNANRIYCGLKHSAVVSKGGDLYTFGFGNWGVLGHGLEENIKME